MIGVLVVNARYRLWQLWQAMWAGPLPLAAWDQVTAVLTSAEAELFALLPANDQWHSVRVLRLLQVAGHTESSLLKAALLHDVGKVKYPTHLWDRVLVVLGCKLMPQKAKQWGGHQLSGWQRPFVVKMRHPEWGAEMAAAAGSDPLTVSLIQRHQEQLVEKSNDEEGRLLRMLQWADNQA